MVQAMKSPAARRRSSDAQAGEAAPDVALRPAARDAGAAHNPVRRLQDELEVRLSRSGEPRWSGRRTLAFLFLTNGLFWVGLALVVKAVV